MQGFDSRSALRVLKTVAFAALMVACVAGAWYLWMAKVRMSMSYEEFYWTPALKLVERLKYSDPLPQVWGFACEVGAWLLCAEIIALRRRETWLRHMFQAGMLCTFANAIVVLIAGQTMVVMHSNGWLL